MKVLVSAFLSYLFGALILEAGSGSGNSLSLRNFTFFYGSIPPSSAPLIFAMKFDPGAAELVATSILFSIMLGGPVMFMTALFLQDEMQVREFVLATVQYSTSVLGVICGAIFLSLVLCIRRHWGFLCAGRQLILAYSCVALIYEMLMVVMSPTNGDALCQEYASSLAHSWFMVAPIPFVISWLQNTCRLLLLVLVYMLVMHGRDEMLDTVPAACRVCVSALLFCLALAIFPAVFTTPSTLNEICGLDIHDVGLERLVVGMAWKWLLLLVTISLLFKAIAVHRGRTTSLQAPILNPPADINSAPATIQDSPLECSAWVCKPPRRIIRILATMMVLRYLIEVVNITFSVLSLTSARGSNVVGSFAQMLVLETVFEHGQLVFLLVALVVDARFLPHLLQVLPSVVPKICLKGSGAVRQHSYEARADDPEASELPYTSSDSISSSSQMAEFPARGRAKG